MLMSIQHQFRPQAVGQLDASVPLAASPASSKPSRRRQHGLDRDAERS